MDEEIIKKRNFNLIDYFKKNKAKILSLLTLIVFFIISIVIYNEYKKNQHKNISIKYNKAKILIENKNSEMAISILEKIISQNNSFYSPSALNLIIDNNLIKDKIKILSYYDQIITKSNLDSETKNLFILKKVIFIGDDIKEIELLSNLKPIIQSDSLWKNSCLDYIKKFYFSKGEFKKAKEFENSINE